MQLQNFRQYHLRVAGLFLDAIVQSVKIGLVFPYSLLFANNGNIPFNKFLSKLNAFTNSIIQHNPHDETMNQGEKVSLYSDCLDSLLFSVEVADRFHLHNFRDLFNVCIF